MAVGLSSNKYDIDLRAGGVVKALRDALRDVEAFNAYLDTMDDEELAAAPAGVDGGYSPEDITLLRASFVDLTKLSRIAHAQDTQAEVNNFFWNASKLVGPQ
jgi:class 3 adenylate cyclase